MEQKIIFKSMVTKIKHNFLSKITDFVDILCIRYLHTKVFLTCNHFVNVYFVSILSQFKR